MYIFFIFTKFLSVKPHNENCINSVMNKKHDIHLIMFFLMSVYCWDLLKQRGKYRQSFPGGLNVGYSVTANQL